MISWLLDILGFHISLSIVFDLLIFVPEFWTAYSFVPTPALSQDHTFCLTLFSPVSFPFFEFTFYI